MILTYDINTTKGIALVAEQDGTNPHYVNLDQASKQVAPSSHFQLRQMHSSSSGIIDGSVANQEPGFVADEWEVYGQLQSS
ncbi:MAG: hypothetical protein V4588_06515 [Pseudomonadota bacterium]